MRRRNGFRAGWVLAGMLLTGASAVAQTACTMPQPQLRIRRANLFSDQQEQWLGDAQADMIEPRYILLPEGQSEYLDALGQRLLQQLPPTPIHYTFRIFESPDMRAFSLAGGHVYISRKLIMDAQSEDELAAMLAQEIGRIYIHHSATAVTRRIESTLHRKHLGGRADVYDTFERMLNMPTDPYAYLSPDEQEHDELMADRVGLYAMIRAHFDPEAFPAFLDRVNDNGGYTGNLLTDMFYLTPVISLRVRMAQKLVHSLPKSCQAEKVGENPDFKAFQNAVEQGRIDPFVADSSGVKPLELTPPMQPGEKQVRLSLDGRYALAQDDYQIHVLSTAPLRGMFSIDAFLAEKAQFSPDSKSVVFHYNDMHVEKWDVATGQPTNIQDFVNYAGCLQTSLSPDGEAMACVTPSVGVMGTYTWLELADLKRGTMLYKNHDFNQYPSGQGPFPVEMRWSRDGRYFVAASGLNFLVYDTLARQTVNANNMPTYIRQEPFTFAGSEKMVFLCDWSGPTGSMDQMFRMCTATFPGGEVLKRFPLPYGKLRSLTDGKHVLFGPLDKAAEGAVDPMTGKLDGEYLYDAVDRAGNKTAMELPDGRLGVMTGKGALESIRLPLTPLTELKTSSFSPNGRYLAVSSRSRSGVWDITTGQRVQERFPFLAGWVSDTGSLQANFIPHEIDQITDPFSFPIRMGSVTLRYHPIDRMVDYSKGVRLAAFDAVSGKKLWTRTYYQGLPQPVPAEGDRTLLVTNFHNWNAHGKLIRTSDQSLESYFNPKGTVVEVIANRTGKPEHILFSPEVPAKACFCEEHQADLFGGMMAVYSMHNETAIYRVKDGRRLFAFFGRAVAGDDSLGMIAATNRMQELNLYDTQHGRLLAHRMLDQAILAAHFDRAHQQLLVVTAAQDLYRIDLAKMLAARAAQQSASGPAAGNRPGKRQ